ncbi:hypothetical protein BH11ARM2_BH11ARM2_35570 [soil metagenome]
MAIAELPPLLDPSTMPTHRTLVIFDPTGRDRHNGKDPQTRDRYGLPLSRRLAALLFDLGRMTVGRRVRTFRAMEKAGELTDVEAYALIAETISWYDNDVASDSPEVCEVEDQMHALAREHGYANKYAMMDECDGDEPPHLTDAFAPLHQAWEEASCSFRARIMAECGEEAMAEAFLRSPALHEMLVKAGMSSLYADSRVMQVVRAGEGPWQVL